METLRSSRFLSWLAAALVPAFGLVSLALVGQASGDDVPVAGAAGGKVESDASALAKPRIAAPTRGYRDLCSQGNARYIARDFAGAAERYERAIAKAPNQPLGYYLLGEAALAGGNLAAAEVAWNRAALEAGEGDPAMHARALFVLADLRERQRDWGAARSAWQTYLDWVTRFPDANGAPASARSRLAAIDAAHQQDQANEGVRARIAETADGGVFTDPAKPSPNK